MRLGYSAASFLLWNVWEIGGAKRDRTADLYNAIVAVRSRSQIILDTKTPIPLYFFDYAWIHKISCDIVKSSQI